MRLLYKILCYLGRHRELTHREAMEWLMGGKLICPRCNKERGVV